MADVMAHVNAPKAWAKKARGKGVTIGIVDTGVASVMKEFPQARRSPHSKSFAYAAGPWIDIRGHGSMCAAAAAASTAAGGKYRPPDIAETFSRANSCERWKTTDRRDITRPRSEKCLRAFRDYFSGLFRVFRGWSRVPVEAERTQRRGS